MIILDTNVIAEPLKERPNPDVVTWLDAQSVDVLYTTALNISELLYGVERLATGKRKAKLISDLTLFLETAIGPRILPFDYQAAQSHVRLLAQAEASGHTLPTIDSLIAAIAHSRGYSVATRDTSPFSGCGVNTVNPWLAA